MTGPDLDRRRGRSWIALAALGAFVMILGACSAPADTAEGSSESAIVGSARWTLPSAVLAEGAKVRIHYDEAPKWTGTAACSGKLQPGGHLLGQHLMDNFGIVSSVGGYSCRRNTADSSRMSVHGTGRALDVFIPKAGAGADPHGDLVANWLVTHAQEIGVQLIIWNHSIWRANGTNAGVYGGPIPHIDHIHVELTVEAASNTTLWFSDDPNDTSGTSNGTADAGKTHDAGNTGTSDDDAGDPTTTPPTTTPPTTTPPTTTPDAGAPTTTTPPSSGTTPPTSGTTPPSSGPTTGTASDGLESAGDTPGETNSLGDSPSATRRSTSAGGIKEPQANAGCSAAPVRSGTTTRGLLALLAFGLVLAARRRRTAT